MYLSWCAGDSSEHQEQAAHTHHLNGNYRSQSSGGVCRQHQGKKPEFPSLLPVVHHSFNIFFTELSVVEPQNDPDKEYNMPKDGTVHELTSNVSQHCCVTPVDLFALSALHTQHLSTRMLPFSISGGGSTWSLCAQSVYWISWVDAYLDIFPAGHPLPAAAAGLPRDRWSHVGFTRYSPIGLA